MTLTRLQRRNLAVYQQYRGRRMTILGLFWSNRRIYVLTVVLFGGIVAACDRWVDPRLAAFMAVAFLAVLVRDIGYFRRSVQIWPLLQEIVDWDKVAALVREGAPPKDG